MAISLPCVLYKRLATGLSKSGASSMGGCFHLCLDAPRPRAPTNGMLGCNQTASSRLFPCSWWSTPLPPALWLGNDFWQSHVGLDYDDLETADINRAGCRSGRQR